MKVPADLYTESPRPYSGLTELDYPFHDRSAIVTSCGRICYNRQKINPCRLEPINNPFKAKVLPMCPV